MKPAELAPLRGVLDPRSPESEGRPSDEWVTPRQSRVGVNMANVPEDDSASSLLGSVPPTEPARLKRMGEYRFEHNHYAAIGRVVTAWSYLEAVIDTWSMHLAGVRPNVGVCLTSQVIGIARKIDSFISLARLQEIPHTLIRELNNFDRDVKPLGERRNRIIHDVWLFNHPNFPERLEATARKKLRLESVPVSTKELNDLSGNINDICNKFDELASKIFAAHHSKETNSGNDTAS